MRRRVFMSLFLPGLLFAAGATPGLGDEGVSSADTFVVNTYTTSNQGFPEISVGEGGDFVVVWESFGQDGSDWGVFAQRLGSAGTFQGAEIQLNEETAGTQWEPVVAVDAAGGFVAAWMSYEGAAADFDIRARRFDSSGSPLGGDIQVNTYTTGYQGNPSIAGTDGGKFLVVWESTAQDQSDGGVYGQLFDNAGQPVGGEVRLNDTTAADQNDVAVATTDSGFAVVWESYLQDGSQDGVVLRYLDTDAVPVGGELIVNTETLGNQEDAALAVAADGTVAVVWETDAQDGFAEGINAQVFDPAGMPVGGEFQVNTYTNFSQKNPGVAADGTGSFIAVWTSENQLDGTTEEVYAQRFDSNGALLGSEFRVNTQATDDQDVPVIAGGPGERALVAWRSFGGHDGDAAGVFARKLEINLFADGFESGDTSAWSAVSP